MRKVRGSGNTSDVGPRSSPPPANGGRLLRTAYTLARATSSVIEGGTNLPRVGRRGSPSAGGKRDDDPRLGGFHTLGGRVVAQPSMLTAVSPTRKTAG